MGIFGEDVYGNDNFQFTSNVIVGSSFTCPSDCVADSISVCITVYGGNITGKCALYKVSDNSLVGVTEERVVNNADFTFEVFNFISKPSLINGTDYYICYWTSTIWSRIGLTYDAVKSLEGVVLEYGSFPSTFSNSTMVASRHVDGYVTYSVSIATAWIQF
jgi:hypothetical protein